MVPAGVAAPAPSFGDARLPSGVRLHYVQQGPPTAPAVLMLHGYTDSWYSFSRVLPLLPADLRFIVPDQRGHGSSDRPAFAKATAGKPLSGYGMNDFADDAIQLMDVLGVKEATVVGHSFGSFVARRMATFVPTRVHRLVLVGAALFANNPGVAALRSEIDRLTDPVDRRSSATSR